MSADKRKSVCLITSSSGLIEGIIPRSFALIITPIVPVYVRPSFSAIFLAL
jgi:hypothetical protein